MIIEVIATPLELDLYGFGGIAPNKDYAATAFKLSGSTWNAVKAGAVKHKGKNIWVYDTGNRVFAGVEADGLPTDPGNGLQKAHLVLEKYARHTHTGSYSLIAQAGRMLSAELGRMGYEVTLPYIEIYGHWSPDENKLETELIMCLK